MGERVPRLNIYGTCLRSYDQCRIIKNLSKNLLKFFQHDILFFQKNSVFCKMQPHHYGLILFQCRLKRYIIVCRQPLIHTRKT